MKIGAITNGYELESFLDFIEEYQIHWLQVTLDGTAEQNDRRRLHKDGLPTYDRILENVELALRRGVDISLRVNVGHENLHGIGALVDDLKERGFVARADAKPVPLPEETGRGHFSYYFKAVSDDTHPEKNVSEQAIMEELMKISFGTSTKRNGASAPRTAWRHAAPVLMLSSAGGAARPGQTTGTAASFASTAARPRKFSPLSPPIWRGATGRRTTTRK